MSATECNPLLEKYTTLDQGERVQAMYVWIDGTGESMRCKTKTVESEPLTPEDLPVWNFDGTSTYQAEGFNSDVYLRPRASIRDPFRRGKNKIVLCNTYNFDDKPGVANNRLSCSQVMETEVVKVCITGADRLLVVVPNRDPRKLSLAMVSPDGKIGECAGSSKKSSLSDADTTHRNVMLQDKDNDPYSVLGVPSDARNDDIRKHKTAFDEIDGRRLLSGKGIEDGHLAQLPSDVVKSLMSDSCSPEEIVVQLKESLHLVEKCLEQPNPETKRTIRCLAKRASDLNRVDVVKHLREITPAGTTGPLLPGNLDIHDIPHSQMRELTIDLSGGEEWKDVAEKLGLSPKEIRYLDKRIHNPCDAALAFISQRRHITVDDLYNVLTECGYPVLADTL
ncbi:uncharacterized protein [Montipora foliosa]|uniref:uncharacterized protein n=1 Tax=Montipora foliosa TaxID=591990 RepID=UPI0035F1F2EA